MTPKKVCVLSVQIQPCGANYIVCISNNVILFSNYFLSTGGWILDSEAVDTEGQLYSSPAQKPGA